MALIDEQALKTPVLLLTFNRLSATKSIFETIRLVKPSKLYISSDGPRLHKQGDIEKVNSVRDYLLNSVDWECEVKTNFREKNLGCKYSVYGAMKWFFSQEEIGIILEDDCLPDASFFGFCEELLEKYKDHEQIGMISGRNDLGYYRLPNESQYFFSTRGYVWGWATWRRVFDTFDVELGTQKKPISILSLAKHSSSWIEFFYRLDTIKRIKSKRVNSWAYPWNLNLLLKRQLAIVPSKNMIKNLGFDENATHTTRAAEDDVDVFEALLPCFLEQQISPNAAFVNKVIVLQYGGLLKFIVNTVPPLNYFKEKLKYFQTSPLISKLVLIFKRQVVE